VQALAALASLDPAEIGLVNFGPSTNYFPRQIKSLTRVSEAQAQAVDVDTGKPIGKIPFFDELVDWYQKHLPDERKLGLCVVHGDYKLDNLIFHPSENKIIGILDWELCTLGSPVGLPLLLIRLGHKLGFSWQTLAISRNHGRSIPKVYRTIHY
jgi:aminoglycoside phosphotransferase (APT) family kinase protein